MQSWNEKTRHFSLVTSGTTDLLWSQFPRQNPRAQLSIPCQGQVCSQHPRVVTIIRRLGAAIATPKKIFHFCSHQIVRQLGRRWHWTSWRCRRNTTNTLTKMEENGSRVKAKGCPQPNIIHNQPPSTICRQQSSITIVKPKIVLFQPFGIPLFPHLTSPGEMSSTTRRRIALSSGTLLLRCRLRLPTPATAQLQGGRSQLCGQRRFLLGTPLVQLVEGFTWRSR